ncbi:hypothetical protein CF327_g103 [Tilletia walkeri]|nr:hypothetical protein CF327_g103 [Tilletia walkeri]
MAVNSYADAASNAVRDSASSAYSQLKPDAHTLSLLRDVIRTASEPHILNYLVYPLGLVGLSLFLVRYSVFASARAKSDYSLDRDAIRFFSVIGLVSAAISVNYFVKNSVWSFEEFKDRAHLVGNLISPLPNPADHPHPLTVLGAHIQRSIDWLYDSQPITEAFKSLVAHEGIWFWTAERLVLISGAWLVLLQGEGHRLVLPYRALYAVIALLGPIALAQSLFFLALLTRAVPDGTLSNSVDFILAADPKGGFHALSEASKQAAAAGHAPGTAVTSTRTTTVTSTRSRFARRGLERSPSQLAMPPPNDAPLASEVLPNGQELQEEIVEEQQLTAGELDLDPPYHVLSHLTLWLTYFAASIMLWNGGRAAFDVVHAREVYSFFALSVLAPFLLPLILRLPTSLPHRMAGTLEHLHNHAKDGWLFSALFAFSTVLKLKSTYQVYTFLTRNVPVSKVSISLLVRLLLLGRPTVLQPNMLHLHHSNHGRGLFGSLNPPATIFAVLDTCLAGVATAAWILYDRARLDRVGALPRNTTIRWRLHAHLSVLAVVVLGPAAGLSLWANMRESQLSRNELKDERKLGRSLHLGPRRSAELHHHVLVQQQNTKVTIRQGQAGGSGSGSGADAALARPTDVVPALSTLDTMRNGASAASGSSSRAKTSARASSRRQSTLSPGPEDGGAEGGLQSPRVRRSTARSR